MPLGWKHRSQKTEENSLKARFSKNARVPTFPQEMKSLQKVQPSGKARFCSQIKFKENKHCNYRTCFAVVDVLRTETYYMLLDKQGVWGVGQVGQWW